MGKIRVISHADADCFEIQAYDEIYPELKKFPRVVVNRGKFSHLDKIVAVDYMARSAGVRRDMKIKDAKKRCPNLKIIVKETRWGKPDTKTPRHASWKIFDEVLNFCKLFKEGNITAEYSSSDEFYLDFTNEVDYRMQHKEQYPVQPLSNFYLEGGTRMFKDQAIVFRFDKVYETNPTKYESEARLIYGGMIAQELCEHIRKSVGYTISAGVSTNKLMAKLACPLHKPGGVTVLPRVGLDRIDHRIKIEDIPGLGGKCGMKIKDKFNITTMRELSKLTKSQLGQKHLFDTENASRFYDLGQGISDEVVTHKIMKDEVSCGKSSIGHANPDDLMNYLLNLAGEMLERLQEEKNRHHRTTNSLQIYCRFWKVSVGSFSQTFNISPRSTQQEIATQAFEALYSDGRVESYAILFLRLTAKNFK